MNGRLTKICLVIPSLGAGGAERVMAILANYLQKNINVEVHLVLLIRCALFYSIHPKVIIHQPDFDYKQYVRFFFMGKIFFFLRKTLIAIRPYSLLSFGGRYNSFALLAASRLDIKTYVSDRSRPGVSYGWTLDLLNRVVYRWSTGIIAQTLASKKYSYRQLRHSNITIIGNPILDTFNPKVKKKNIILNVGRFIKNKQQEVLIDIFSKTPENINWQLWFVGEGEMLPICKNKAENLKLKDRISFFGNEKNIFSFYQTAKIFAFTSISEGFPNALGEAMMSGCACISFDCVAGPSDLIDDGVNGFLIPLGDNEAYIKALHRLIGDDDLCNKFGKNAQHKMEEFEIQKIGSKYLTKLLPDDNLE